MNSPSKVGSLFVVLTLVLATQVCFAGTPAADPQENRSLTQTDRAAASPTRSQAGANKFAANRRRMVRQQLQLRDIADTRVLAAMNKVPRHQFVPEKLRQHAYKDQPLPIGNRQTISQPYIVALMTQLAEPTKTSRALDVGTGSGYQAAVLAELADQVYSIEIVEPLAKAAKARLNQLGYKNVQVRHGDGYQGWQEHAPFDLIIVAAAPRVVPQPLIDQLAGGGRLVIPVGKQFDQHLVVIEKQPDGSVSRQVITPPSLSSP